MDRGGRSRGPPLRGGNGWGPGGGDRYGGPGWGSGPGGPGSYGGYGGYGGGYGAPSGGSKYFISFLR